MAWNDGSMTLSAQGTDKGESEATLPVQTQNGPGRIAANYRYLLEYISGKEGLVTMSTKEESSPIVFRHGKGPVVVIMPMFVQW